MEKKKDRKIAAQESVHQRSRGQPYTILKASSIDVKVRVEEKPNAPEYGI